MSFFNNPYIKSTLKRLAWILSFFLVLVLLGYAAVMVPKTRIFLVETILSSFDQSLEIEYSGVESPSVGQWKFDRLKIYLHKKTLIDASKISIDFSVEDLFEKKLTVNSLAIENLKWYQPEKNAEANSSEPTTGTSINLAFWPIKLTSLDIAELELDLSVLAIPDVLKNSKYSISAEGQVFDSSVPFSLDLYLVGIDNKSNATIISEIGKDGVINIKGDVKEEKGGVLGALLQFPKDQNLAMDLILQIRNDSDAYKLKVDHLRTTIDTTDVGAQANIVLDKSFKSIDIKDATLQTNKRAHTFDIRLAGGEIESRLKLDHFPLELLQPWVNDLHGGYVDGEAHLSGEIKKPVIDADLRGEVSIVNKTPVQRLKFATRMRFDWRKLLVNQLEIQDLTGEGTTLEASGSWSQEAEQVDLSMVVGDLGENLTEYISTFLPKIPGNGKIRDINALNLTAKGSTRNKFKNTQLKLSSRFSAFYQERLLKVDADLDGTIDAAKINKFSVQMDGAKATAAGFFDLTGEKNDLLLNLSDVPLSFLVDLGLNLPQELAGKINAEAKLTNSFAHMNIDFDINSDIAYPMVSSIGEETLEEMTFVARGNWGKSNLKLEDLQLQLHQDDEAPVKIVSATSSLNFSDGNEEATINVKVEKFPMSLLQNYGWPDEKGVLDISMQANSSLHQEDKNGWLNGLGALGSLRYVTSQLDRKTGEPVNLELNIDLKSEKPTDTDSAWWIADFSMIRGEQSSKNLILRSKSDSLIKFIGDRSSLPTVEVMGQLDFSFFNFLLLENQRLEGLAKIDLQLSGDLEKPDATGELSISEGKFAYDRYGIKLQNIDAVAVFEGKKMLLNTLTARDMGKGMLESSGYVDWQAANENGDVSLTLKTNKFETFRHEQVEGKVNADISVSGNFEKLLLEGNINVTPFSASIAQNPGPAIPQLNYEFSKEQNEKETSVIKLPELSLDLHVNLAKQAFIRGRGLEAELAGSIALLGPIDAIEYKGEFKTVRGQFTVMGRRFSLERGEVGLTNNALVVFIVGVYQESGLKVTAELKGTNQKFDLKLTSEPSLPEDELLAKLIFGRAVENITPLQAIQLAQAVKSLQGDGGFDPIEKAREALNVDTIKLNTDETDDGQNVSLGAGKYITNKVYLELERSSDPANPWQGNILIELSPHLSLESTSGGSTGGSAEITWKIDY